jgi:hypothetical protein
VSRKEQKKRFMERLENPRRTGNSRLPTYRNASSGATTCTRSRKRSRQRRRSRRVVRHTCRQQGFSQLLVAAATVEAMVTSISLTRRSTRRRERACGRGAALSRERKAFSAMRDTYSRTTCPGRTRLAPVIAVQDDSPAAPAPFVMPDRAFRKALRNSYRRRRGNRALAGRRSRSAIDCSNASLSWLTSSIQQFISPSIKISRPTGEPREQE